MIATGKLQLFNAVIADDIGLVFGEAHKPLDGLFDSLFLRVTKYY